jgi:hypothetical protein
LTTSGVSQVIAHTLEATPFEPSREPFRRARQLPGHLHHRTGLTTISHPM